MGCLFKLHSMIHVGDVQVIGFQRQDFLMQVKKCGVSLLGKLQFAKHFGSLGQGRNVSFISMVKLCNNTDCYCFKITFTGTIFSSTTVFLLSSFWNYILCQQTHFWHCLKLATYSLNTLSMSKFLSLEVGFSIWKRSIFCGK